MLYMDIPNAVSLSAIWYHAGDLLGGDAAAPAAAASSAGGMFAGLDVGTSISSQQPSQSATASSSFAPQSPLDALAGLQGPSPSQPGSILI